MIKIAVNGAEGRMGSRILALAAESGKFEILGKFDNKESRSAGIHALSPSALGGKNRGVLIDFSSPEGTVVAFQAALKAGWGLVVGTTGLEDKTLESLSEASKEIPIIVSSNMSVGVNVMADLLEEAARKLPKEFTVQMTEAHHHHKKDAPSGTALMLAKKIAAVKNWDISGLLKTWKAGGFNKNGSAEKIDMKVIREGEIVGDHTVLFSGPSETVEITHRAQSRDTFVRGALLAAEFLSRQPARGGWYSMRDVLSSAKD